MKPYIVVEGSSEQDEMSMSMFGQPAYSRESLVQEVRLLVGARLADADDELTDENVADRLDTEGELTINLYDGYGETMYKIFEV